MSNVGETVTVGLEAGYAEVPVLLLVGTGGDGFRAFLAVGAPAGIRTSCEVSGMGMTVECEDGDVERYDASAVAGAGFTVPLGFGLDFGAEVLYLHGVLGIDEEDTMTRTSTATAGFGIPLR